jgi:hypothetical protein
MLRYSVILALASALAAAPFATATAADETVQCAPKPPDNLRVIGSGVWSPPPGSASRGSAQDGQGKDQGAGGSGACQSSTNPNVPVDHTASGRPIMRDSNGNAVYGDTNAQGVTTFHPSSPPLTSPRLTATPDGAGGVRLQDQSGKVYNPPTDPSGTSTVHTDSGQVVRCYTIPSTGQAVCN